MKTLILMAVLLLFTNAWGKKPTAVHFNQALMESVSQDVTKDEQIYRGGRAPASLSVPEERPLKQGQKPSVSDRLEDQQNNLRETERMNQRQLGPSRW